MSQRYRNVDTVSYFELTSDVLLAFNGPNKVVHTSLHSKLKRLLVAHASYYYIKL